MNAENMQITLYDSLIFLRRIATEIITAHLFRNSASEDETGSSHILLNSLKLNWNASLQLRICNQTLVGFQLPS
jgi:hypothetical protein